MMPRNPSRRPLWSALAMALMLDAPTIYAQAPVHFNTDLLVFPVDVSLFTEGNPVAPGTYRVDVYLNQNWQGKHDIAFDVLTPGERIASPCFSAALLDTLGIDSQHVNADMQARLAAGESICAPLPTLIASARADFDVNMQRLDIHAPQIVLVRRPRGFVDPKRWDAGIPAARLAYDYNAWHSKQAGLGQTSHYLGLRAGVNVGNWRFRYRATATKNSGTHMHYQNSAMFVERALPAWRSALLIGEAHTRSQVFDSLSFRGVRLESDERMRPDSHNGFAPVISGIAQSNARVRISQRGVQILETNVPPGPFVIDDLHPNGSGGDLLVTITEADGDERSFTVTNASLPQMLRPGMVRYSVAGGRHHDRTLKNAPFFGMGSASVGINNTFTGYGGLLWAQHYYAASSGVGMNLAVGAVTLDLTYARTALSNRTFAGTGWRLAYSKLVSETDTDFSLAMLRYASRNYYEPVQAFRLIDQDRRHRHDAMGDDDKRRYQFSLNVRQLLPGDWGTVSAAGSVQNYWQRNGYDTQYSVSYGRNIGRVSVSINAMRSRNANTDRWDNQYLLSLSVPLGNPNGNPVYLSTSLTHSPNSRSMQNSLSGSFGEQQQYHYGVYATTDKARDQATRGSGGANLAATTPYVRVNGNLSSGSGNSSQQGLHVSGGMVLFRDGLVFSPELGDTVAIIQAKHAEGVKIPNAVGARLDTQGHAVAPYLRPYRDNDINLDPKGISTDVELFATSQRVAPTHGAVVLLSYPTRRGYAMLTTLQRPSGDDIPFAAGVFDDAGRNVGYVAQGQRALLRVDAAQGELTVRWGTQAHQQCRFTYELDETMTPRQHDTMHSSLRRVEAICLARG